MNIRTNAYLDRALELIKEGWDSGDIEAGVYKTVEFISNLFITAHPNWKCSTDFEDWDMKVSNNFESWFDSLEERSYMKKWMNKDADGEYISMFDYDIECYDILQRVEDAIRDKLDGKKEYLGVYHYQPPKKRGRAQTILNIPLLIIRWLFLLSVATGIALLVVWLFCLLTE